MNIRDLHDLLDELIPDAKIVNDFADLAASISEELNNEREIWVEIEEDERIAFPVDARIKIISKAVFKDSEGFAFGVYKVMIAVGGLEKESKDELVAKYFFSTLYYNEDGNLLTWDFHKETR